MAELPVLRPLRDFWQGQIFCSSDDNASEADTAMSHPEQRQHGQQDLNNPSIFDSGRMGQTLDYQLYALYKDCAQVTERLCKQEFGINRRRWLIIATLTESEGTTVSHLAQKAELDIAQTSRAIGTLMREGYLRRLCNPENARYARVVLTDKGRELHSSLHERYKMANESLLNTLSSAEVQQLSSLIEKLRRNASALKL